MGYSKIQKRSIRLGKELVKELSIDSSVDTLSRWMVHYFAEQVVIVKHKKGGGKTKAKQHCLEMLTKLQQHQASPAHERYRFESFGPIYRILKGLGLKTH